MEEEAAEVPGPPEASGENAADEACPSSLPAALHAGDAADGLDQRQQGPRLRANETIPSWGPFRIIFKRPTE
eukprot:2227544-Lingulodinium_polyedra.AAC.1